MEHLKITDITIYVDEPMPAKSYYEWLKRDIKRHGLNKPIMVAKRSDGVIMLTGGYALLIAVGKLHAEGHVVLFNGVALEEGMIPVKYE